MVNRFLLWLGVILIMSTSLEAMARRNKRPRPTPTPTATPTPIPAPVYSGSLDGADCTAVRGWIYNINSPNAVIAVQIYDGTTLIQELSASEFRQDLLDAGIGNGFHGFTFIPNFAPGSVHSVAVMSGTYQLGGTINFVCPAPTPTPTATPLPSPIPSATPVPSVSPSPIPTPTPLPITPTPSPWSTPTPIPTISPTPSPTPDQSVTLSATPLTVIAGATVSTTWTASYVQPQDWIGFYKVGALNGDWITWGWAATPVGSFSVTAPSTPGQYEFRYLVTNSYTSIGSSNAITILSPTPAPTPPPSPTATILPSGQVKLSWTASPSSGVTGYLLYYGNSSGAQTWNVDANMNLSATLNLTPGLTYYFVATAYNSTQESLPSNEVHWP